MKPMIEIHYTNGRKRRIPESSFIAQGESITNVIDIGFDNIEDGLVLYYRHYEPIRSNEQSVDVERDPRGLPAELYNDTFTIIIPKNQLDEVDSVYYEGTVELMRFSESSELLNLHKVNKAQSMYLNVESNANTRLLIAELFRAMMPVFKKKAEAAPERARISIEDIRGLVATDLGVPENVIDECLEFQENYALGEMSYAIANKLPYVDENGEVIHPGTDGYNGHLVDNGQNQSPIDSDSNEASGVSQQDTDATGSKTLLNEVSSNNDTEDADGDAEDNDFSFGANYPENVAYSNYPPNNYHDDEAE